MLIGLRGKNLPDDVEKAFLHAYIRDHYGMHTPAELRLAFDLAIQGRLRLKPDDVKCYENFSVQYLASILNAFREWAAVARQQLQEIVEHQPEAVRPVTWRPTIEADYQHFLLFGPERSVYWPSQNYDQLVTDGALREDLFKRFLKQARKELVGEQVREQTRCMFNLQKVGATLDRYRSAAQQYYAGKAIKEKIDWAETAQSINQVKLNETSTTIEEFNAGKYDAKIVMRAKQIVLIRYYQELKDAGLETVYTDRPPEEGGNDGQG